MTVDFKNNSVLADMDELYALDGAEDKERMRAYCLLRGMVFLSEHFMASMFQSRAQVERAIDLFLATQAYDEPGQNMDVENMSWAIECAIEESELPDRSTGY